MRSNMKLDRIQKYYNPGQFYLETSCMQMFSKEAPEDWVDFRPQSNWTPTGDLGSNNMNIWGNQMKMETLGLWSSMMEQIPEMFTVPSSFLSSIS